MIFPHEDGTAECQLLSFGEMLARRESRVTLSDTMKDKWGVPAARIACEHGDNEATMAADQLRTMKEILSAAGYDVCSVNSIADPGSSIHEVGTARMGTDARSSVLNKYNQCWDVPNLFVTDGAAFVNAGFQNPTTTMMALTARACHHISRELRRGSF
jgi:choline dehydrogenase-like flavoprotein